MLKIKTAVDYREELIGALRSGRHRQCEGWGMPNVASAPTCFLGVALREFNMLWIGIGALGGIGLPSDARDKIAARIGLGRTHIDRLVHLNDNGGNFDKIADHLEALPYTEAVPCSR